MNCRKTTDKFPWELMPKTWWANPLFTADGTADMTSSLMNHNVPLELLSDEHDISAAVHRCHLLERPTTGRPDLQTVQVHRQ